jgi:hypothetical protein
METRGCRANEVLLYNSHFCRPSKGLSTREGCSCRLSAQSPTGMATLHLTLSLVLKPDPSEAHTPSLLLCVPHWVLPKSRHPGLLGKPLGTDKGMVCSTAPHPIPPPGLPTSAFSTGNLGQSWLLTPTPSPPPPSADIRLKCLSIQHAPPPSLHAVALTYPF